MNQEYVNWLVNFIKNGTINTKTGKPFSINDIKMDDYKNAAIAEFKAEVVAGTITTTQYRQYTGLDYVM